MKTVHPPMDLLTIDPYQFESLVAELLRAMGLETTETKKSGDGGVDVVARSSAAITGGLFVVQCKRYSQNVGEPVLRDLFGAVHHHRASKGILISTSGFTRQAQEFAQGKPLELVDGDKLTELLRLYRVGTNLPQVRKVLFPSDAELPHEESLKASVDTMAAAERYRGRHSRTRFSVTEEPPEASHPSPGIGSDGCLFLAYGCFAMFCVAAFHPEAVVLLGLGWLAVYRSSSSSEKEQKALDQAAPVSVRRDEENGKTGDPAGLGL